MKKALLFDFGGTLDTKRYLKISEDKNLLSRITTKCYNDVIDSANLSRKIIKRLKENNYLIGVVSNFYGNLKAVLKELSLYEYFDVIIDSFEVGIRKPNPAIFQTALERIKVRPGKTYVVGDSYSSDILPAKSLGCKTIWLDGKSWDYPEDISQADHIIHSIEEVEQIISNNKTI